MGVYIGAVKDDYSALQGPAPDGFHVPSKDEWVAVHNVWTALGGGSSAGTNFGIALKLPFAGYRSRSSAGVYNQGTNGLYWSSSRSNANFAYRLDFGSTAISPQSSYHRASGFSVRCFKNSPVIPTSSWTKLYGTSIEAGGIFWNSTDGLISLSSDGTTWITIADKNLGATTVWNSGDTLSEANCGKYYQWGNNYGFPRTGTIENQSTTQVDASAYGPGNYYSSDTFIKYNGRWDTTDNGNLRGGVTGLMPTSLKNAYIGEVRVPGANTIAYYPLKENTNDYSGNSRNLTNNGLTFGTYSGVTCASSSGNYAQLSLGTTTTYSNLTMSIWYNATTTTPVRMAFCFGGSGDLNIWNNGVSYYASSSQYFDQTTGVTANQWTNIIVTVNGSTWNIYKNGSLYTTKTNGGNVVANSIAIGTNSPATYPQNNRFYGYLSNGIIENKVRTAQEVANYYNLTKSNYQSSSGGGGSGGSIPAEPL